MKKEELISSVIMCIVCVLVLVGFTIAWFTTGASAVVTGLQVVAGEMSAVKISLTSGGLDIEDDEAAYEARYASFGMPEFTNVETDTITGSYTIKTNESGSSETKTYSVNAKELGPGTYGEITFYVSPKSGNVTFCDVSPRLAICQDEAKSVWYRGETEENTGESDAGESGDGADEELTVEELYEIATNHIRFYKVDVEEVNADGATTPILSKTIADDTTPTRLSWVEADENGNVIKTKDKAEFAITYYWKWDYEYPFDGEDEEKYLEANLTDELAAAKEALIDTYDNEDMTLGNNVSGIKFEFLFVPQ